MDSAADGSSELVFQERFACATCGFVMPELTPQLFSFNSPRGACEQCEGLGTLSELDPARVIPDPDLSLNDGAIKPWSRPGGSFYTPQLASVAAHFGFALDVPWKKLPKKAREVVLHGSGKTALQFDYTSDSSRFSFKKPFEGVMNILKRRLRDTDSEKVREDLQEFMSKSICPACDGARLNRAARRVQVGGKSLVDATHLSIGEARAHFEGLAFGPRDTEVARPLTKEVLARLSFLAAVGLDYLSLDRASTTLSGGEAQRIRLATQVGSALQGVVYVLDEPSIGLHQRDNERLIRTLQSLRDLGNTVLVVEHDEDTIRAADHVIDMGPGAGLNGGRIVAQGTPAELERSRDSLTGQYLSGRLAVPLPVKRRKGTGGALVVRGARGNNLKNIDATFPLGTFTCVTGVSGSGKSTLVNDTLYEAVARHFGLSGEAPAPHDGVEGLDGLDKVIAIDQSAIGRTPRSNPATYTGIFQLVRDLFAGLPEARTRGYGPGRFSFNVKGGRCETCEGDGVKRIEMHFLPDVFVVCDACHGARYNRDTLEVHYKDKSIAQVLAMTVAEAQGLLGVVPQLGRKLDTLAAVGLGYVSLGQAATTLSGGEAQRIKLARELSRRGTGRTLYVLDEPTTGLHVDDVKRLLEVLHELVDQGNTVVVIEHQLDVIKTADWVIDLGPEGGNAGGSLVAAGTPEELARCKASHTGRFLARMLDAA